MARLIAGLPAALTDGAVLAFALWTLLYHAAFLFSLRPSTTFLIWLVACLVLGTVGLVGRIRGAGRSETVAGATTATEGRPDTLTATTGTAGNRTGTEPAEAGSDVPRRWLPLVVGAGALAALTAGAGWGWVPWWVPAVAGLVAAGGALFSLRRRVPDAPVADPAVGAPQSLYALVVSGLVAVSSFFMARNTPDDVFYVGKSTWVAERDQVPIRDFLFTEGVLPGMSSQPPISSIETFAGALGGVLGVHAASATWYLLLPVLAVLAVLALWRLVHRWAPRRPVLAFTVAIAFLYLVCGGDAALGTFHLPRLYEGKGMFVSAVIPLMWLYLTQWQDSRSYRALGMVVALSVVGTGLTSTAAIILPLLAAAAAFGLVVAGRWRAAVLCLGAIATYPVAAVVVSRLALGGVNSASGDIQFFDAEGTYRRTLMIGVLGVICGLALWLGPLLVRRGTPALLAASAAVAMSVLLVPGVLELVGAVSGLSAVLWRVPWILALPGLVGILCTVRVPRLPRLAGAATATVLAGALVGSFAFWGVPMWSPESHVTTHSRPTWKLPQQRQKLTFWMRDLDRPPGLLLAPSVLMRTMPIVTADVRVVMARNGYLVDYDWNSDFAQDRLKLSAFADGTGTAPIAEIGTAIDRVGVTTICVYSGNRAARDAAVQLGFEEFASRRAPGAMNCFRKPSQ